MTERMSGQCLCGAVKFKAVPRVMEMAVCHCDMCRKWSGSVVMATDCEPDVTIEDEAQLGVYVSSDWAERLFCRQCGTNLMWRTRDKSMAHVCAQAFDHPSKFKLTMEIFVDQKPETYAFANDTQKLTAAEVFAMFPAPKES